MPVLMQVTNTKSNDLWYGLYDTHQKICGDLEMLEFKMSVHGGIEIHKGTKRLDVSYNAFDTLDYSGIISIAFFFPRFTKQVWKVENAAFNVLVQLAMIFLDLITLPCRLYKSVITLGQTGKKIEHPFRKYLEKEEGVSDKVLDTPELEIKVFWVKADRLDSNGHRYYDIAFKEKKIPIEKTNSSQEDSVSKWENVNASELVKLLIRTNFSTKALSAYFEKYAPSLKDQNPTVDDAHQ